MKSLFRTAIDLDPKFAEAYLQLGILCSEEKKDSEALRDYEKAVELNPNLADAHYRLGQALFEAWRFGARRKRVENLERLAQQPIERKRKTEQ